MARQRNLKDWSLPGMVKDKQSVTRDWQAVDQPLVDGVAVIEVKNVPTNRGYLTEIYRGDWNLERGAVDQVFQTVLEPRAISAWHSHARTTDRLFASVGQILIVLYDGRQGSPTYRRLNQFRFGTVRPALVTVPAGVWHGVQNVSNSPSVLLNLVSDAYSYEHPDHYRLPVNSKEIPFQFHMEPQDALRQGDSSVDSGSGVEARQPTILHRK
jgi:dTDP-4-dehydrorhamnose 3,5-epimerase